MNAPGPKKTPLKLPQLPGGSPAKVHEAREMFTHPKDGLPPQSSLPAARLIYGSGNAGAPKAKRHNRHASVPPAVHNPVPPPSPPPSLPSSAASSRRSSIASGASEGSRPHTPLPPLPLSRQSSGSSLSSAASSRAVSPAPSRPGTPDLSEHGSPPASPPHSPLSAPRPRSPSVDSGNAWFLGSRPASASSISSFGSPPSPRPAIVAPDPHSLPPLVPGTPAPHQPGGGSSPFAFQTGRKKPAHPDAPLPDINLNLQPQPQPRPASASSSHSLSPEGPGFLPPVTNPAAIASAAAAASSNPLMQAIRNRYNTHVHGADYTVLQKRIEKSKAADQRLVSGLETHDTRASRLGAASAVTSAAGSLIPLPGAGVAGSLVSSGLTVGQGVEKRKAAARIARVLPYLAAPSESHLPAEHRLRIAESNQNFAQAAGSVSQIPGASFAAGRKTQGAIDMAHQDRIKAIGSMPGLPASRPGSAGSSDFSSLVPHPSKPAGKPP